MVLDDIPPDDTDGPEADLLPDDPAEGIGPDDPSDGLGPDVPQVPEFSEEDAPTALKKQFWSLVLLFNVALFGMSLGAMLVGFEGRWRVGGAIFVVGAVAFVRGWIGYRRATDDDWETDDDAATDDAATDGAETDDAEVRKD